MNVEMEDIKSDIRNMNDKLNELIDRFNDLAGYVNGKIDDIILKIDSEFSPSYSDNDEE